MRLLEASDRVMIKTYYKCARNLTKSERLYVRELIKEIILDKFTRDDLERMAK